MLPAGAKERGGGAAGGRASGGSSCEARRGGQADARGGACVTREIPDRQSPVSLGRERASGLTRARGGGGPAPLAQATARVQGAERQMHAVLGECLEAVSGELSFIALENAFELFGAGAKRRSLVRPPGAVHVLPVPVRGWW